MLGLIKKDIYITKNNLKILLLIAVVYLIATKGNIEQIIFMLSFMSVIITMTSFSYDMYNHWDTFVCSLPNGRKNVVLSKYISGTIIITLMTIILLAISYPLSMINKNIEIKELLTLIIMSMQGVLIIESFMYPVIFKFGIEKARYIIFIMSFLIAGLSAYMLKSNNNILTNITTPLEKNYMIVIPIITIIVITISYFISKIIYKNKEF
ncbi:MAG: ABC-2 transporter permease [Bacilli bacterium]|nr:ABC-2 transporter permease [Bacilli bacterium]